MRSENLILKVAWKLDIAFSQKLTFLVKIGYEGAFQDDRKFPSIHDFNECSCEEDYNFDLLKNFEHFISSSLSAALIWTFLDTAIELYTVQEEKYVDPYVFESRSVGRRCKRH